MLRKLDFTHRYRKWHHRTVLQMARVDNFEGLEKSLLPRWSAMIFKAQVQLPKRFLGGNRRFPAPLRYSPNYQPFLIGAPAIAPGEARPFHLSLEHCRLLTQQRILQYQVSLAPTEVSDCPQDNGLGCWLEPRLHLFPNLLHKGDPTLLEH
jgi:hypothetical protein